MISDFNKLTGNHEKKGGQMQSAASFVPLNNMIRHCGIIEFRCVGQMLSWQGKMTKKQTIRCRLDRALGNEDWHSIYAYLNVKYLEMIGPDHRSILGEFNIYRGSYKRSFRFDKRWVGKERLHEAINMEWMRTREFRSLGIMDRIANCRNSISWWRKNNVLSGQANWAALKEALEEAKKRWLDISWGDTNDYEQATRGLQRGESVLETEKHNSFGLRMEIKIQCFFMPLLNREGRKIRL